MTTGPASCGEWMVAFSLDRARASTYSSRVRLAYVHASPADRRPTSSSSTGWRGRVEGPLQLLEVGRPTEEHRQTRSRHHKTHMRSGGSKAMATLSRATARAAVVGVVGLTIERRLTRVLRDAYD